MSKSKASEMVRGAGMSADLVLKLIDAVKERGGSEDDIHQLVTPAGAPILAHVADHLVRVGAAQRNCYPVKMSHSSLKDAIQAVDCGDNVNSYITAENFKIPDGEIVVDDEFVFFHPDHGVDSDDAVQEMDQLGLRPATLQELCGFGEKYPDIQREFPVVALASVYVSSSGYRSVAYLYESDSECRFGLAAWYGGWGLDYRFLAVRKQPLDT